MKFFFAGGGANLHSPGPIGDVMPGTVGVTVLHATGTSALDGNVTCGSNMDAPNGHVACAAGSGFYMTGAGNITAPTNGVIVITNGSTFDDVNRLCWGAATAACPSMKRSSAVLQARLGDDSDFASLQGKITTDTNATTGLVAGVLSALTNASLEGYDASGQKYRIPCII